MREWPGQGQKDGGKDGAGVIEFRGAVMRTFQASVGGQQEGEVSNQGESVLLKILI